MRKAINAIKQFFGGTEHELGKTNRLSDLPSPYDEEIKLAQKIADRMKKFLDYTEEVAKSCDSRPISILGDEIDIAEYRYNVFDDFESPVMCGICGKTPAKYNVLTHPSDGPPYSHDYCAKCFTSPLAKEQINAENPSR